MKSKIKKKLVIWDQDHDPNQDEQILLWNSYDNKNNQQSILNILEKNSDQIRSYYLSFIGDLSKINFKNKKVIEHLKIQEGFSLWWMSLLAEKGTLKSKTPLFCLKVLTLNKILLEEQINSVQLISNNKVLADSLYLLCKNLNIVFDWENTSSLYCRLSLKNIRKKIPHFFQALIFFVKNIFMKWSLRNSLNTNWLSGGNTFFFFSYFLNIDFNLLKKGDFYSKYWNDLPDLIKKSDRKINWIHHFMTSTYVPNAKIGNKYLRLLNKNPNNSDHHNFLYSFISIIIVLKTFGMWIRFFVKGMRLTNSFIKEALKLNYGWLTPIITEDWKSSVYGKVAIQNILWIYLLQKSISTLPLQKTGLYLCENQGWERAFIYFWEKYNHGKLIGVAHSSIRYWDLRYFEAPQVLKSKDIMPQPLPNKMALNGPAAFNTLKTANQPMDLFEKVEAIRYQHLGFIKCNDYSNRLISGKKTLLIIGDYTSIVNHQMLGLLNCFNPSDWLEYKLIYKPHPATHTTLAKYINIVEDNSPLKDLLSKADLVIASGNTVASIEAWLMGLHLIVVLEKNNINFSPLRGEKYVSFVTTGEELKSALKHPSHKLKNKIQNDYFWIDPNLPKWNSLLNLK